MYYSGRQPRTQRRLEEALSLQGLGEDYGVVVVPQTEPFGMQQPSRGVTLPAVYGDRGSFAFNYIFPPAAAPIRSFPNPFSPEPHWVKAFPESYWIKPVKSVKALPIRTEIPYQLREKDFPPKLIQAAQRVFGDEKISEFEAMYRMYSAGIKMYDKIEHVFRVTDAKVTKLEKEKKNLASTLSELSAELDKSPGMERKAAILSRGNEIVEKLLAVAAEHDRVLRHHAEAGDKMTELKNALTQVDSYLRKHSR